MLHVDDPFFVRRSEEVLEFAKAQKGDALSVFLVDVKDRYYSLPHSRALSCVEECIDKFGAVAFQNKLGISSSGFLELLSFYPRTSFSQWGGKPSLQKQ